ncbi:MAG: DUF1638 domain-containing protein [bacterium]
MKNAHFKLIACNVLWRELCHYAAVSDNRFTFEFLSWGLHSEPDKLREAVQRAVDATPENTCDAILLGYGLCSNGLSGITARHTRLVIFRGHDCITCFLGSKERYREYFDRNPGAYWYTPGWIENHPAPGKERYDSTFSQYAAKYGEDNAQYLMEMEQDWFRNYSTAAYVDLGIGRSREYEAFTRECAEWLKWKYERLQGDPRLVERFVAGDWDPRDFLVVEPGYRVEPSHDETVVKAVKCGEDRKG